MQLERATENSSKQANEQANEQTRETDKIILTGNYAQSIRYEKKRNTTFIPLNGGRKKKGEKSENSVNYKKTTINKQRNTVRNIILGNFEIGAYVWNLTFAERIYDFETICKDIASSRKVFKNFIGRLKTISTNIEVKYLAVYEFTEAGAVHFHVITNILLSEEMLAKLWAHSNTTPIDKIKSFEHLQIVSSYFVKNFHDPRIGSRTPYIASRNLSKQKTFTTTESIKSISDFYDLANRNPISLNSYDTLFRGKAEVQSFILD